MNHKESDTLSACLAYCHILKQSGHILWYSRLNSGTIIVDRGGKKYKIRLCEEGTPDIQIIIHNDKGSIWVETKRPHESLSKGQEAFRDKVCHSKNNPRAICEYWHIFGIDDFINRINGRTRMI